MALEMILLKRSRCLGNSLSNLSDDEKSNIPNTFSQRFDVVHNKITF